MLLRCLYLGSLPVTFYIHSSGLFIFDLSGFAAYIHCSCNRYEQSQEITDTVLKLLNNLLLLKQIRNWF